MPGAPNRTGHFATGTDRTQADGLPQMPPSITAAAAAKWNELLDQLPRPALRRVDSHQLRILCELLALVDVQTEAAAANPTDPKLSRMLLQTAQHIHRLSSCFGLTPADRARMSLPEDEGPDELQLFLEAYG
ncbi:MAG: P27 family phage terminase small subunit [Planctomycetota bacterium]|jgi:phage terminase small subunit